MDLDQLAKMSSQLLDKYASAAIELKYITLEQHNAVLKKLHDDAMEEYTLALQDHLDTHHTEGTTCEELSVICDTFVVTRELGTGRYILADLRDETDNVPTN